MDENRNLNFKQTITNAVNNIRSKTTSTMSKVNEQTNMLYKQQNAFGNPTVNDLYINVIFFFVLTVVVVNDLQLLNQDNDDPHYNKNIDKAKTGISSILLICVLGYIIYNFTANEGNNIRIYYYSFLLVASTVYGYLSMSHYKTFMYLMKILVFCIVIVAMAIIFSAFTNFFKSLRGYTSFIVYLLFYIPCLLLDLVTYVLSEFKSTTNPVLILFIIELALLLLYVYFPKIKQYFANKDGKNVLEKMVLLNEENIFDINDLIIKDTKDTSIIENGEKPVNRNYALSMWVFLNNYSTSMTAYNKESLIFDYGNGKPKVTFFNDQNDVHKMDTYRFYFSDQLNETNNNTNFYEINMPSQKWNHIFFNYTSRNVDLYINGKLERTFNLKNSVPSYNIGDVIRTGSDNGLSGAISNIRYYNTNMSRRDIVNIYNMLLNKNPPVNNL